MALFDEIYLEQVEELKWQDPNPEPIIQHIPNYDFYVVRDDLLGYGSKARFVDCLIKHTDCQEWIYGGTTKTGWGPISLGYVCSQYNKKATIFAAARKELTEQQKLAIHYGCNFQWVEKMGMLSVCEARAKRYYNEDTKNRKLVPIGLEHPLVFGSIIKVARNLKLPVDISEIWSVGGSGTLSRGLQMAFPDIPVNIVQTGHKMSDKEIGRAKLYVSPLKYDQKAKDLPPYPSEIYYDAKAWEFIKMYGKKSCLIWNVA